MVISMLSDLKSLAYPSPMPNACSLHGSIPPPGFDHKKLLSMSMALLKTLHPSADPSLVRAVEDGEQLGMMLSASCMMYCTQLPSCQRIFSGTLNVINVSSESETRTLYILGTSHVR